MIYVIIPQFKPLYEGMLTGSDQQLPLLTRIIMGISDFTTSLPGASIILVIGALIGYFVYWAFRVEKGINWRQERELFLPNIGFIKLEKISKLIAAYHGSVHLTSLGQVMKATDLVTALKEVADDSPHIVFARVFETMAETTEEHSGGFAKTGRPYSHLLGDDFYSLMETGSQGDMSEEVLKLAAQLQEDYENQVKQMMALITPATIAIIGVTIGITVIAMYLPMLDLIGKIATSK
jgi:type IV pilus assembly protein PilC